MYIILFTDIAYVAFIRFVYYLIYAYCLKGTHLICLLSLLIYGDCLRGTHLICILSYLRRLLNGTYFKRGLSCFLIFFLLQLFFQILKYKKNVQLFFFFTLKSNHIGKYYYIRKYLLENAYVVRKIVFDFFPTSNIYTRKIVTFHQQSKRYFLYFFFPFFFFFEYFLFGQKLIFSAWFTLENKCLIFLLGQEFLRES